MLATPCILFAGGKSSRMGEDKALLPFGTFSTLTQYQYTRLSKIFLNVYISTKTPQKFNFSANFIIDLPKLQNHYAPTSGFITAFENITTDRLFVISVDSPFIEEDIIKKLIKEDNEKFDATIAKTQQGVQAMCGVYHRSLLKSFKNMQKNNIHKLIFLLKNSNTNFVEFDNEQAFLNINYPREYEEALLILNS